MKEVHTDDIAAQDISPLPTQRSRYHWKLIRLTGGITGHGHDRIGTYATKCEEMVALGGFSDIPWLWQGPGLKFYGTGLTGTLGEVFEIVSVAGFARLAWLQAQRSPRKSRYIRPLLPFSISICNEKCADTN